MTALSGSYDFEPVTVPALAMLVLIAALGFAARAKGARGCVRATASSLLDRVRAFRKSDRATARERELYFQTMADAIPEIIWTADPNGMDDFFNQRCFDYTGLTLEQLRGASWQAIIHPDDLEGCLAKWTSALQTGNPYDVEYRLRGKDGGFR